MSQADSKACESGAATSALRRKALVVLGMHRSGTSALTRILNLLGADISANLMPALEGNNEQGFWESQDIFEIQERMLLAATGQAWDSFSAFPRSWCDSSQGREFQEQLLAKLVEDFSSSSSFVLKDPRICRLVPFWLNIFQRFETEPFFIIPIRNPIEVARSLKARDGFHFSKSYLLWLRHNLDAERDTRGLKRCFVTYESLLADWRSSIRKVFIDLGLTFPDVSPLFDAEIESFLSPRWRHHAQNPQDVFDRPDIVSWVKSAYRAFLDAAGGDTDGLAETLDGVRTAFEEADLCFSPLVAEQSLRFTAQFAQMQRKADEATRRGDGLLAEFEALQRHIEKREQALDALEREAREQNRRLEEERAALAAEIDAMRQSTSWKLTQPIRSIGRVLK